MPVHEKILHNGEVLPMRAGALYAGQLGLLAGWGVFTTLRIQDGCPFAWDRHWARLSRDARLLNVDMPASSSSVYKDLLRLVEANGRPNCTMRLNIVRNGGGTWEDKATFDRPSDVIALTADSRQWGESVRLSITANARHAASEFAGAKILSWSTNLTLVERAQSAGFDETILLNEHGRVAECTSANIFAIFGSEVVTPPLSEGCLPGITREVLLQEVLVPGIALREESLTVDRLHAADSVFITSSTRDLLRVREIEGAVLRSVGGVCDRLSEAFQRSITDHIQRARSLGLTA